MSSLLNDYEEIKITILVTPSTGSYSIETEKINLGVLHDVLAHIIETIENGEFLADPDIRIIEND